MEQTQQQGSYLITEPIRKLLPKFTIPCVISLIIPCLYNIVDQIFVGNGIGYLGNAATGIISLLLSSDGALPFYLVMGRLPLSACHRDVEIQKIQAKSSPIVSCFPFCRVF